MIRLSLLLLSIVPCSLIAQAFSIENITAYNDKTYSLNDYGCSTISATLILKPNNSYSVAYESVHGLSWYNSGRYEQTKDVLKLFPTECYTDSDDKDSTSCSRTLGNAHIELVYDNQSLYFTQYIIVRSDANNDLHGIGANGTNSFRMGIPGKEVIEGAIRYHGNYKVVTTGMKLGITTSEVKIRNSPDLGGEVLEFHQSCAPVFNAVPIETEVTVIARTENKVKVQKWENYWYLVNVGCEREVWMFAEFVKFN